MRAMAVSHASQHGEPCESACECLDLITVYHRYLKWVLRFKCEIHMARWLADLADPTFTNFPHRLLPCCGGGACVPQ